MWVAEYGLKPVMPPVFPNVIRVHDSKVWVPFLRFFFCNVPQTHSSGVPCYAHGFLPTTGSWARLSGASLSYAHTDHNVPLLCLVAKSPGSIRPRWVLDPVDRGFSSPFYGDLPKIQL